MIIGFDIVEDKLQRRTLYIYIKGIKEKEIFLCISLDNY